MWRSKNSKNIDLWQENTERLVRRNISYRKIKKDLVPGGSCQEGEEKRWKKIMKKIGIEDDRQKELKNGVVNLLLSFPYQ